MTGSTGSGAATRTGGGAAAGSGPTRSARAHPAGSSSARRAAAPCRPSPAGRPPGGRRPRGTAATARIEASGRPSAATTARIADRTTGGIAARRHGQRSRGRRDAARRRATRRPGRPAGPRARGCRPRPRAGRARPRPRAAPSPNRAASWSMVPCPISSPGGEDPDPVAHALDLVEQVARQQDGHAPLAHESPQELEHLGRHRAGRSPSSARRG